MTLQDIDITELEAQILKILEEHPGGFSEYELITCLRMSAVCGFDAIDLRDRLDLFRCHFLVFHALYRLRERLWAERQAELHISALLITLHAGGEDRAAQQHMTGHDPLRDYYLDLTHLEQTTTDDVDTLLNGFWSRLTDNPQRQQALETLGLSDPVDENSIRRQYRRLAMRYHPDRGGDKEQLQAVNAAMDFLMQGYK